jgi:hypothetical protein
MTYLGHFKPEEYAKRHPNSPFAGDASTSASDRPAPRVRPAPLALWRPRTEPPDAPQHALDGQKTLKPRSCLAVRAWRFSPSPCLREVMRSPSESWKTCLPTPGAPSTH